MGSTVGFQVEEAWAQVGMTQEPVPEGWGPRRVLGTTRRGSQLSWKLRGRPDSRGGELLRTSPVHRPLLCVFALHEDAGFL